MRLGYCGAIDDAARFAEAGFDFVEVNTQRVLRGDLTDEAWETSAPDPAQTALPMEAANGLVPADLPIVGPQRDLSALSEYMDRVTARANRLGIKRLVFGSGGARRRPDDVDPHTAFDHIAEFCRLAGEACARHQVVMVIEHLRRAETNTINTLEQERELMERVDHPNVAALVDTYHYGVEQESDQALLDLDGRIEHVHVAEVVGRCQPGGNRPAAATGSEAGNANSAEPTKHDGDGEANFDFEHFFSLLHKVGYQQRVSFEGEWTGAVEQMAPPCVELLRGAWRRAYGA